MKKSSLHSHFIRNSAWAFLVLTLISWVSILSKHGKEIFAIFSTDNAYFLKKFIYNLLGIGKESVAYLDSAKWMEALKLSASTFIMSVLAIGLATLAMLFFVLPTARNVASGHLFLSKRWYDRPLFHLNRWIFLIGRAVPELLWAMILLYFLQPGILPGALALALHNFGILGKLVAELIEDMDERPIQNLVINGANRFQVVFYGLVPTLMPKVINYVMYRFENIIRASLIVGIVGAGGLGMQIRLAMSFFRYTDITLYLLCYIILVYLADVISALSKRFIQVT